MDAKLMEIWSRWLTTVMLGQNQMDMMSGWWLQNLKNMSTPGNPYAMPGVTPMVPNFLDSMQQAWEPLLKMQQNSLQWMGMVPKGDYETLAKRAEELEDKVRDQAQTIDRLRDLLRQTGGENNVVVNQLQDLIGQQSKQFKQFTQSVGDYIKSSTENVSPKK